MRHLITLCFALFLSPAFAADAINMPLSRLLAEDQSARRSATTKEDWEPIRRADAARRAEVIQMLKDGLIRAPIDYENAAMIMQHGETSSDYRLAHALATISVTLEPERRLAKWLQAATWDRLLNSMGRLQWYGTQSRRDFDSGAITPLPVDRDIPNTLRIEMGMPSIELQDKP